MTTEEPCPARLKERPHVFRDGEMQGSKPITEGCIYCGLHRSLPATRTLELPGVGSCLKPVNTCPHGIPNGLPCIHCSPIVIEFRDACKHGTPHSMYCKGCSEYNNEY